MLSLRFCIRSAAEYGLQHIKFHKNIFTKNNNNILSHKKWYNVPIRLQSSEENASPSNPDVFGDIGGREYEEIALDKEEKELEEFEKTEVRVPRSLKLTPGQYAHEIKEYISKHDIDGALSVLDTIKLNRDKPNTYMFNLIINEYAKHGNLKQCIKFYTIMKKRQLKPNGATYTSMLYACANCPKSPFALESLNNLRQELIEKNVILNNTHYNAMVNAYGRHNCILEAFQLVDEMVDKKIYIDIITINSLLCASITDKINGLRHSLIVWHLMQARRIKPGIETYNLLLRAIRDTKLGDLKVNDRLVGNLENSQIRTIDDMSSDLLAASPVVSNHVNDPVVELVGKQPKVYKTSNAASNIHEENNELECTSSAETIDLNKVHENNRLILFGGFNGFLQRMEADNVAPDAKTITLLMEIMPNSLSMENNLIATARARKIPLNIDFYNMLIKKRSFRRDYKRAKQVLDEIQVSGLRPNVMTWGVLALGCQSRTDAQALLDGMEATGHTLNTVIAGSLIGNACSQNSFMYILDIMELMWKNRVTPSEHLYTILDKFQQKISDIILKKTKSKHSDDERYKTMFSKFNLRYSSWQEQFGRVKKINNTNDRLNNKFANKYVHNCN